MLLAAACFAVAPVAEQQVDVVQRCEKWRMAANVSDLDAGVDCRHAVVHANRTRRRHAFAFTR